MAYIKTDEVKAIRENLKKDFPAYKFSVVRDNTSGVCISVMEGPIKLSDRDHEQINVYWIENTYKDDAEKLELFSKIMKIAEQFRGKGYDTADYGHQPTYYISINVGQWNKPYVQVAKKEVAKVVSIAPAADQPATSNLKKIRARFGSKCAETGMYISKGEEMYYDYSAKKCYSMKSNAAQLNEQPADQAGQMVQANEEAYFDNFCQANNI